MPRPASPSPMTRPWSAPVCACCATSGIAIVFEADHGEALLEKLRPRRSTCRLGHSHARVDGIEALPACANAATPRR